MNRDYNDGWRSACDSIMDNLNAIAPPQHTVIVTANQIRDLIQETRADAFDDPRLENLSEQEQRLLRYGIQP